MATRERIKRVENLIWVLAYAGLLTFVLGLATRSRDGTVGWVLMVLGAIAAIAGAVLVWVRSRMQEDGPG